MRAEDHPRRNYEDTSRQRRTPPVSRGVPVHELHAAQRFLEYLRHVGSDPVLQALQDAPEDDELETPEEQAAVQEARDEIARGETLSPGIGQK